jgi:uncharacterized RDD family membrane protein YckC
MSSDPAREASQETTLGQHAGFVTRMIGFVVDRLVLAVIFTLLGLAANLVLDLFPINEWLGLGESSSLFVIVIAAVLGLAIAVLYNVGFWMLVGQTPGQNLLGVRVVTVNGERIRFWPAVRRWLGYFVSAILFLGFLWVLVDDRRQGFHDKMAGTVVIYDWPEGQLRGTAVRDRAREVKDRREQRLKQRQQGQ